MFYGTLKKDGFLAQLPGRRALQTSGLSWPSVGLNLGHGVGSERSSADHPAEATQDCGANALSLRHSVLDMEDGTVEGEQFYYRFWARWACR